MPQWEPQRGSVSPGETLQVIPPATVLALALVVPVVLVNRFIRLLAPIPVIRHAQESQNAGDWMKTERA